MTDDNLLRPGDVVWVDNHTIWLITDGHPERDTDDAIASYCLVNDGGESFYIGEDGWFTRDALDSERKLVMRNAGTDPRAIDLDDSSDFDCVIEDFRSIAEMIGVDFKTHEVRLHGGGTRQEPNIWWSGFCSQGDGACFEGTYHYAPEASAKVREYCSDEEVLRIADELTRIQTARILLGKSTWEARIIKDRGYHYNHEHTVSIDVDTTDDYDEDESNSDVDTIATLMRDLMRWLYKRLDEQNDYVSSDEYIDDQIEANEYMFDEDGDRHAYA